MGRVIFLVIATICLLGNNAMADNFTFSFTSVGGWVAGDVTGEIFGLQDNAISSATEVLITSYPLDIGPIFDLDATKWTLQEGNSFQELDGIIKAAAFGADDSTGYFPILSLGNPAAYSDLNNYSEYGVTGPITYSPATVPEPSAWILLLTVILAVAIVKRSRRTDGLADPATRMRS